MIFKKENSNIIDIYKIAIEMSDKISSRRINNNNFFITLNWTIMVFLSSMFSLWKNDYILLVLLFWVITNFVWITNIISYKTLNKVKFNIIHKIEDKLPIRIFQDEWIEIKKTSHKRFSDIEKYIPIIFISFYIFIIMFLTFPYLIKILKCISSNI